MKCCWLCDKPIQDPPQIIGRILAGETRVAHLECWRYLGEVDLDLRVEVPAGIIPSIGGLGRR